MALPYGLTVQLDGGYLDLARSMAGLEALTPSLLSSSGLALNAFVGGSDAHGHQSLEFNLPEPMPRPSWVLEYLV